MQPHRDRLKMILAGCVQLHGVGVVDELALVDHEVGGRSTGLLATPDRVALCAQHRGHRLLGPTTAAGHYQEAETSQDGRHGDLLENIHRVHPWAFFL